MLIDGRKIAENIASGLDGRGLNLLVIQVGQDPATNSFIRMKKKFAERIGVQVVIEQLPEYTKTVELVWRVSEANRDKNIAGVIVQLPLPDHVDEKSVLEAIKVNKDPDALSLSPLVLPPVVGAIAEIVERYGIELTELDVAVVGYGKLVGQPVCQWLRNYGVKYVLATSETKNLKNILQSADVIISGAGVPGLIRPDMIKEGVVLIDAGTSESPDVPIGVTGKLAGDCDPLCASKAHLMTPVPGGVGPIAVAMLFRNLIALSVPSAK
ncbi:MAG TPA: bifunctional 5,10-methylenetetrahydrofolate dehydrogenase/5,10-methenyltetrahydrofolate cyclohydrolase [Candidatus Paceibacterota bacterium]